MTAAHAADAWLSDGNYALATFDIRLPRADLIVWYRAAASGLRLARGEPGVQSRRVP
jgi:hypothetical protein